MSRALVDNISSKWRPSSLQVIFVVLVVESIVRWHFNVGSPPEEETCITSSSPDTCSTSRHLLHTKALLKSMTGIGFPYRLDICFSFGMVVVSGAFISVVGGSPWFVARACGDDSHCWGTSSTRGMTTGPPVPFVGRCWEVEGGVSYVGSCLTQVKASLSCCRHAFSLSRDRVFLARLRRCFAMSKSTISVGATGIGWAAVLIVGACDEDCGMSGVGTLRAWCMWPRGAGHTSI